MKIKLLTFGLISDIVRSSRLLITDVRTTKQLMEQLHREYPELKKVKHTLAVNQRIIRADAELREGDEVAILAPFAGG